MLTRVYVEITNVCNLHCDFCPGTTRPPRFMSPAEFSTVAGKLREVTGYLYLHVMGEPLLHPALADILDMARAFDFRVCITTNGTLLTQALPTLTAAPALHKLSVSLHSFEGNGGGDMSGYLTAVWNACAALTEKGVLCALRLWNEGGGEARNREIEDFLSARLGREVSALAPDAVGNRRLGEHFYLESARRFDWPHPDAPTANVQFCHGLRHQLAVLCDGTVVPCCLDGEGRMALGNLFVQELSEIVASPRAAAMAEGFARRQPTEALCRRCGYAARFNR